eukprot:scaffold2691_cov171-Skeletonema_marinoi.AAC.1
MAAVTFAGPPPSDDRITKERDLILQTLEKEGIRAKSKETMVYGYHDPVITPNFLRRNEVAVMVDGKVRRSDTSVLPALSAVDALKFGAVERGGARRKEVVDGADDQRRRRKAAALLWKMAIMVRLLMVEMCLVIFGAFKKRTYKP